LSILAGAIPILYHQWFFDKSEVDVTLSDHWKRMSTQEKLDSLDGLLSKNEAFFLLSRIKQLRIRSQLRKMIVAKKDEVLKDGVQYSFGFRYDVGWLEASLLGLVGFASVWMIYASIRMVTLLIPHEPVIHFPSPRLSGWVESLHFPTRRVPLGLVSIRITLFGFLVLEERPKRPKKPAAVWID
jgi:energy-converting hydrogenase Eha subunit A